MKDSTLEPTNDNRAMWAEDSMQCFQDITGTDRDDMVCDLVCDIMHWCDLNDMDFDHELQRAKGHYLEEVQEEAGR